MRSSCLEDARVSADLATDRKPAPLDPKTSVAVKEFKTNYSRYESIANDKVSLLTTVPILMGINNNIYQRIGLILVPKNRNSEGLGTRIQEPEHQEPELSDSVVRV